MSSLNTFFHVGFVRSVNTYDNGYFYGGAASCVLLLLGYIDAMLHVYILCTCMLQLVDGRVQYTFECGSGPASMITGENMNDGNWHNVTLERNGEP
mgnify:CR=1 FL=1